MRTVPFLGNGLLKWKQDFAKWFCPLCDSNFVQGTRNFIQIFDDMQNVLWSVGLNRK